MKKITLILACILIYQVIFSQINWRQTEFAFAGLGCTRINDRYGTNTTYNILSNTPDNLSNKKNYQDIKNAGIDILMDAMASSNYLPLNYKLGLNKYIFDLAKFSNLKVMLMDMEVSDFCYVTPGQLPNIPSYKSFFSNLNFNDPTIYGFLATDEPPIPYDNYFSFVTDLNNWPNWRNVNKPAFTTISTSDPSTVQANLQLFKSKDPFSPIICYDQYPFTYLYPSNTKLFQKSYFYTLYHLKKVFPSRNLWATVHTANQDIYRDQSNNKIGGVDDANMRQLQFMAFCPIAYGAKGLQFWPVSGTAHNYAFGDALMDDPSKLSNVTKINHYVKDIIGPIVINNQNIATLHKNTIPTSLPSTSNIPSYSGITGFQPEKILQTNQSTIVKDVSVDDILIGVFSSTGISNKCNYAIGDNYYLFVVNKETYANTGFGTPRVNMTITLHGDYRNNAFIYQSVDNYNGLTSGIVPSKLPVAFSSSSVNFNSITNETKLTIDKIQPGEGRMIKIIAQTFVPIKPAAPFVTSSTKQPQNKYILTASVPISTTGNPTPTYNWYNENGYLLFSSSTINKYVFTSDNCNGHTITCKVTYNDCNTESDASNPIFIAKVKPYNPVCQLVYARFAINSHPTIANTITIGVDQTTLDEQAKLFFDATALAVEQVQNVSVINKEGQVVMEVANIGTQLTNLYLSTLSEGVYTIIVSGNNDYKEQQTYEFTVTKTPKQLAEELATDNILIADVDAVKLTEVLKQELYQKLKDNSELLENSTILQNFMLTREQGDFGTIEKINDALYNYDVATAQMLINNWLPTTNLELNCLQYYNHFIKYLNGGTFTSNDLIDLYGLANLCPQKNGEIIYAARSLYNYVTQLDETFSTACGNNLARGYIKIDAKSKIAVSSISIYPNPSKGNFSIKFPSTSRGLNTVKILDTYGKTIMQQSVISGTQNININKTLASGIYTVQITNNISGKTDTQKLIINN